MNNFPRYVSYNEPVRAQHINSIIDTLRRIQPVAGANVSIDQGSFGTRINAQPKSVAGNSSATIISSEIKPFDCRWYVKKDKTTKEETGEWQIYLPFGCASISSATGNDRNMIPVNDYATDDNDDRIPFWYKIQTPKDKDADVYKGEEYIQKSWSVYFLYKPYPRMKLDTDINSYETVLGSVPVNTISTITYKKDKTENKNDNEEEEEVTTHTTKNLINGLQQKIKIDYSGTFSIGYEVESGKEMDPDAKFDTYLYNGSMLIVRSQQSVESGSTKTKITDYENVYVIITHDSENFTVKISQDKEESNEEKSCIRIYTLKDNVIQTDTRSDLNSASFLF